MTIKKAVIELVVLFDDTEVKPSFIEDGTLGDIEAEMNDGSLLGLSTLKSMVEVKPADLQNEILALGNDGTFFDALNEGPQP